MDPDTFRGDLGVEGPDVYWRRRVSVLTGALVVVAVVAWACTSASGGSKVKSADQPPAVGPNDSGPRVGAAPFASSNGTPTASSTARAATPGKAAVTVTPSPRPSRTRRPGDPCEDSDLVLSLRGQSEIYSGKETPSFLLTVVNISDLDCTVDVGPREVETRITSGADRIWSSADCLSGQGADVRRLRRGIPHVSMVSWDRRRAAPDCRSARPWAGKGTYVATARLGEVSSSKVVFHLR